MRWLVVAACVSGLACSEDCRTGEICAFAGTGEPGFSGDEGDATLARLDTPIDVVASPDGTVFVVDWNGHAVRAIGADGKIRTILRGSDPDDREVANPSSFNHPTAAALDVAGRLVVAAWHNGRVKRLDPKTGAFENIAGAPLELPSSVAVGPGGDVFVLDQARQLVERFTGGVATRIAGACVAGLCGDRESPAACAGIAKRACLRADPEACSTPCLGGFDGDGKPALDSRLSFTTGPAADPSGRLALDGEGRLLIADTRNHRIRRIETDGRLVTIAGTGQPGFAGDGSAADKADLNRPMGLAVAPDGEIFVADTGNSCVRGFTVGGSIRTVAGRCTERGNGGDGGPATEASLDKPYGIALDTEGRLLVADTQNHRVRRVILK